MDAKEIGQQVWGMFSPHIWKFFVAIAIVLLVVLIIYLVKNKLFK